MTDTQLHLEFLKYEAARRSDKFNMIIDAEEVMKRYNIQMKVYWYIIKNYSELNTKYLLNYDREG